MKTTAFLYHYDGLALGYQRRLRRNFNFCSIQNSFFLDVENENSPDKKFKNWHNNKKFINAKIVSDYLETKKTRKKAVKYLPFVKMYVPDRCKTQEICNKVIVENLECQDLFLTTERIK